MKPKFPRVPLPRQTGGVHRKPSRAEVRNNEWVRDHLEMNDSVCERCGSEDIYRMHAVIRCSDCGYKTDCCGW